ncbi:arsenate reductase (glutaredoxin) [Flagellimonas pacifica]|uniref:Arsenate reductase n=1 Tax=Flagellimonas pacifica TaxID=1247520 RepID=A0A285MRL8_9FLAO|nr:arsenate reductase (glutaredoxin) [Allomuricauda parva]SNY99768.1 arsenate reductase [Allomuricauda parva]
MIKIYHNPRCSKSRQGVEYLEKSGAKFEVVRYLDDVPTESELKDIVSYLGISPEELVRKNESIWKEKYKGKILSDDDIVSAMVKNPKLIERPIIIKNGRAVIGRPTENIDKLL